MEKCPKCKGLGWIYSKEIINGYEYEFCEKCECYGREQMKSRIIRSGINAEDLNKGFKEFETFRDPELTSAKRTTAEYCINFIKTEYDRNNSLLVSGSSGRGKTTLCLAVTANLIKDYSVDVYYMPYVETVKEIKQSMMDKEEYMNLLDKIKKTRVLFIDDLFKGKVTEADVSIIYDIINHRYLKRHPVIITTELSDEALMEIDAATGGRIVEMCKDKIVKISDNVPNYRTRKL